MVGLTVSLSGGRPEAPVATEVATAAMITKATTIHLMRLILRLPPRYIWPFPGD